MTSTVHSRPVALSVLWIALMAPLSLAGTALQSNLGIDYATFPLVMAGPALAAAVCFVAVPHWFPPAKAKASRGSTTRSAACVVAASIVFVTALWAVAGAREPIVPAGSSAAVAVGSTVIGLSIGSLCEEIGYRGVLYRAFESRWSTTVSVIVNGAFFGLCHVQYFGAGLGPVALFLVTTIALNVVMVSCWSGSWSQRIVVAAAIHTVVNLSLPFLGITGDRPRDFLAMAVALSLAAVVAVPLGRRLGVGDLRPHDDRRRACERN